MADGAAMVILAPGGGGQMGGGVWVAVISTPRTHATEGNEDITVYMSCTTSVAGQDPPLGWQV